MDSACSERQNQDPLMNYTKSRKKCKKKRAERENAYDDCWSENVTYESANSHCMEMGESEVQNNVGRELCAIPTLADKEKPSSEVMDVQCDAIAEQHNDPHMDYTKSKKKKKKKHRKHAEREDLAGIDETSTRDEVIAEEELNLNDQITLRNKDHSDSEKKKKQKIKMHSDGDVCNTSVSMSSQPREYSLNEQCNEPLGMDATNLKKRKKNKRKHKERQENIDSDQSIRLFLDTSDEHLPTSKSTNLLSSESGEIKENKYTVGMEIRAGSSFTNEEKPSVESMDVTYDTVAEVEVKKKKSRKKLKMSTCNDNEICQNSPFSLCVDELYENGPKPSNIQSTFELRETDSEEAMANLLNSSMETSINSPDPCKESEYIIPNNIECSDREEMKVKKKKKKKLFKEEKDSEEIEGSMESNGLPSCNTRGEEDFNSSDPLRDKSSNLDETLSSVGEKDMDMRSSSSKFSERRKSGSVEESDEDSHMQDSLGASENDTSPSGTNPLLHCAKPSVEKNGKKEKGKFACDECNRVYTRKNNLFVHKKVKHECVPMFKCATCSKCFQYKHVLVDHINYKHNDAASFDCELCSYKAKKEQDLKKHVMAMHEGMVFPCPKCKREFSCKPNLRRHIKVVHLNQNDFVCAYCGRLFSQGSNLKLHMEAAHSDKTTTCIICKKDFTNRQKLSMHLLGHSPKVGFNCPHCDYVLASDSDARMKRHIREKHSNVKEENS